MPGFKCACDLQTRWDCWGRLTRASEARNICSIEQISGVMNRVTWKGRKYHRLSPRHAGQSLLVLGDARCMHYDKSLWPEAAEKPVNASTETHSADSCGTSQRLVWCLDKDSAMMPGPKCGHFSRHFKLFTMGPRRFGAHPQEVYFTATSCEHGLRNRQARGTHMRRMHGAGRTMDICATTAVVCFYAHDPDFIFALHDRIGQEERASPKHMKSDRKGVRRINDLNMNRIHPEMS